LQKTEANQRKAWDVKKAKDNVVFRRSMEERMRNTKTMKVEDRWKNFKENVVECATEHIGYKRRQNTKKPWITTEVVDKMNERRIWKSCNTEDGRRRYKKLNNELRRETDKAKENVVEQPMSGAREPGQKRKK
jgi:hypothetical protein